MGDVSPINWKGAIVIGKLIYAYHGHCPLSASDTTLGTEDRRPDGCHTPLCGPRPQAPSGIQESTAPPTGIYQQMIQYLFSPRSFALWRPCRESPSQPKLALSLHIKGPSDCWLTDPG